MDIRTTRFPWFAIALATVIFAGGLSPAQAGIERFSRVQDGIYRGSQPESDADYAALKSRGVRTIIDLRWGDDQYLPEKTQAHRYGIRDLHFPMNGLLYPNEESVEQILRILSDKDNQPVFVHCHAGKDRTGLIVAMYRIHRMGWKADDAFREMLSFGFNEWLIPLDVFFWQYAEKGSLP